MILRNPRTTCGITIGSRPDAGSEEIVMTAYIAQSLLLDIDSATLFRKKFRVANGKSIGSIGRAKVKYRFAREATLESCCFFYVFPHLISRAIMGMTFLDITETLVKKDIGSSLEAFPQPWCRGHFRCIAWTTRSVNFTVSLTRNRNLQLVTLDQRSMW